MFRVWIVCLLIVVPIMAQDSPHGTLRWKCTDCHSTNGWKEMVVPMKFDHSRTSYMLRGQHQMAECVDCHSSLKFVGTSKHCYSCHRQDFESAALPNHVHAGFGTDCERCHSVEAQSWRNSFDHNKTEFPLRGAHEGVACNQCHTSGTFRGVSRDCFECHQKEYLATTNPNHQAAKFPTNCEMCHRALTWQPAALFPHDSYFPISSGSTHSPGRWNSCGDCHTTAGTFTTHSCTTGCHATAHNKNQDCYTCHKS